MVSSRLKDLSNLTSLEGLWQRQVDNQTDRHRSRLEQQLVNRACIKRVVKEQKSSRSFSRRILLRLVQFTQDVNQTLRVSRFARWQSKGDHRRLNLDLTKKKVTSSQPIKTLNARRNTRICKGCRSRIFKSRMWLLRIKHEKKNFCCSRRCSKKNFCCSKRCSKKNSWPSRKLSKIMTSLWETKTEMMPTLEMMQVQITSTPLAMA